MKDWRKWEIVKIDYDDPLFPNCLKNIKPKIKQLYFRGKWDENILKKTIAVVGSRRMTRYGRETTDRLVGELVGQETTVISGFMYGVDAQAHLQCIDLGGKTIAVMGGGLDYLMVSENDELYTQILESGGLAISEYEATFKPTLWSFPQRNRIVAGLATLGVVVVEAGMKSGSLITADLAHKQGKNVWAVPGPINSSVSKGCNWLIGSGRAIMMAEVENIWGQNGPINRQEKLFDNVNDEEKRILDLVKDEGLSIDEVARNLSRKVTEISVVISMLQMKGLVREEGGKIYLN